VKDWDTGVALSGAAVRAYSITDVQLDDVLGGGPFSCVQYTIPAGTVIGSGLTNSSGAYSLAIPQSYAAVRLEFSKNGYDHAARADVEVPALMDVALVSAWPQPPEELAALPGAHGVLLRWWPSTSFDVAGYNVYRRVEGATQFSGPLNGSVPADTTRYSDDAASPLETYEYQVTAVDTDGYESLPAGPVSATAGQALVLLPQYSAGPGAEVGLPVALANAAGISPTFMRFNLTYPGELVEIGAGVRVEPTAITAGMNFTVHLFDENRILITGERLPGAIRPLAGEGRLFDIVLRLRNDIPLAGEEVCGSQYLRFADYEEDDGFQPGVLLYDQEESEIPVDYSGTGTLCLSPECRWADLDYNRVVGRPDADVSTQIAVRMINPDPCQTWAGDLSLDRRIDSADTIMILREARGLSVNPGEDPDALVHTLPETAEVTISVGTGEVQPGADRQVNIPVRLDGVGGMAGLELMFAFPPELRYVGAQTGALTSGFDLLAGSLSGGAVFIHVVNPLGLPVLLGEGVLVVLRFEAAPSVPLGERYPVNLANATLTGAYGDNFSWYTEVRRESGAVKVPVTHTLTIAVQGDGTTDPGPGVYTFNEGTSATITAAPGEGCLFTGWQGDASGAENPLTLSMNSDLSLTAVFTAERPKGCGACGPGQSEAPGAGLLGDALVIAVAGFFLSGYWRRHKHLGR
jgi:hypothetical protein